MHFGVFQQGENEPIEVHEGDFIQMTQPQVVEVVIEGDYNDTPRTVAYMHLGPVSDRQGD